MAVVAFIFGSLLGVFVGLFAWALVGVSAIMAFGLYLTTALLTGGMLIITQMSTPPGPPQGPMRASPV